MALTGQLGTADSKLGNFVLGYGSLLATVFTVDVGVTVPAGSAAGVFTFVEPVYTVAVGVASALTPSAAGEFSFIDPVYTVAIGVTMPAASCSGQFLNLANLYQSARLMTSMYSGGF